MDYRKLGKTEMKASIVGLGGEWLEKHDLDTVQKVIDRCDQQGINILDVFMSNPTVRSNLGTALKGKRDHWLIQGHLCSTWADGQYCRNRDLAVCKEAFADLLTRLQTDYIDIGMIHFVDAAEDYEAVMNGEIIAYARELKKAGTIRCIGMSSHNPEVAIQAAESGEIDVIMMSINPAYDMLPCTEDIDVFFDPKSYTTDGLGGIDATRDRLYRTCEANGVSLTVMKGFGGGTLLDAARSPFQVALTPEQCIHYALTRPGVASFLAGCQSEAEVDAAVAYLSADEARKDYASVLAHAPRNAYHGHCTYCGHCAPCPAGIDVAMVNKYLDLGKLSEEVPATVREHYALLSATGKDCLACGACVERCPFGVPVIERMEEAAKLFSK